MRTIKMGDAQVMFAGGTEATISQGSRRFLRDECHDTRNEDPQHGSRPSTPRRDGFVMGEGTGNCFGGTRTRQIRGAKLNAICIGTVTRPTPVT